MAASINKVIIVGNVGRDPEVRTFNNGGKVANLRVATSQRWKDRTTGEQRERTEWHAVSIMAEHAVNFAEQYIRKGSKVYIEGMLETRKWQDQSGQDRYTTEVVVRPYSGQIIALDKREGSGASGKPEGGGGGSGYGSQGDHIDDEIPF